jgi:hypothetical protein
VMSAGSRCGIDGVSIGSAREQRNMVFDLLRSVLLRKASSVKD